MSVKRNIAIVLTICAVLVFFQPTGRPQSTTASVTGRVLDPSNAAIPDATVTVLDVDTQIAHQAVTNDDGLFNLSGLLPGNYRIEVAKPGFKTVIKPGVVLHVQDVVAINFNMILGSVAESVTVEGGAPLINADSAAVSTVVDRQFAENLPMNGRSFQTLIQLTPGVVLTTSNQQDGGQFSVNGQRAASNYWMVDGVSANIGIGVTQSGLGGNGTAGALPAFSAQGGTNGLVSVDALQEFRILTSTYAPEFGRTPGGQISIVTRSGTNQYHGNLFDYFRNDVLDANDWFANRNQLAKPKERQNDFGGTFGGSIIKDRTFFFFSYEGLRLRLPQVAQSTVPDLNARQNAVAAIQPYLNAFPLPNGLEVLDSGGKPTGAAQFNASFSNSASLDATSVRIDHKLSDKLSVFGRYNYSPSELLQRGVASGTALSAILSSRIANQTATMGTIWVISPAFTNDLRFNYSRVYSSGKNSLDTFGGAVPLTDSVLSFPSPFSSQNAGFNFGIFSLLNGFLRSGKVVNQVQHQINVVDSLTLQRGSHSLKVGADFRRLSPLFDPISYRQSVSFGNVASAVSGRSTVAVVVAGRGGVLLFHNLGLYAQDTWRTNPRLTLTYGLRWDVDFAPSSSSGPNLLAVTNFNDLSKVAAALDGTPLFKTTYGNIAPRLGVAYRLSSRSNWETVVRGGFGIFYDLATQEVGEMPSANLFPFGSFKLLFGKTFPLDPTSPAPPVIAPAFVSVNGVYAFDPNLKLPYTLQWKVALEQSLAAAQTVSASYIGAVGRRLTQTESGIFRGNPTIPFGNLVTNGGNSYYEALQLQYQRRLSHGLQALASYSWSHSIDTGSASSLGIISNYYNPQLGAYANRGPSDFDIRHVFSSGVTYDIPAPKINAFTNAVLRGWSVQNIVQVHSAPPVTIYSSSLYAIGPFYGAGRPDITPGIPPYLFGPQYPGRKAINFTVDPNRPGCKGPFCPPPVDPNTGLPLRQGTLGRNALRGFGATQWDFAVHRNFPIRESLKLQFRAEMFNVLNHPNFGQPIGNLTNSQFGRSAQMLGRSLDAGNQGNGSFSPLYQIGGPRSIQFTLKFTF